ncbi:hypothetical protein ROHU_015943 [Labeo rohita]|uniref:Uncharacterized protein n=1 Tax=Labeo rohita TaxID=84645 RepID=A0A498NM36_LABRO|nr:hypothetical protein ROHU_015943 [Labeo rohita]
MPGVYRRPEFGGVCPGLGRRGRPGKGASFPGTARTAPATPEGGLRGRWSFYPPSGYQYIPGRIRPAAVGGSGEAAAPRKLDPGGHGGRLAAPAPGLDGSPQAWVLSSRGGFSSGASPRKLDSGGRGIRPSPPAPWLDGSGTRTRYGLKKGRRASPRVFPGRPVGFGKTQLGSNLHPPQGYLGGPGRAPRPRARRGRLPRPRREVSGGDGPFTRRRDTSIYLDVYVRRPWGGGSGGAAAPRKHDSGGHGGRLAPPAPGLDGSPQAWVLGSRGSFSSGASPRKLDSGGQGGRLAPPTPGLDGSPQAWLLSSRGLFGQRRPRVDSHSGGRGIRPSPPAPWRDGSGTRTRYGLKKGRRASPRVFPGRPVGFGKTQLGSNLHPPQGHLGRPGRAPRPRARRGRLPRPRREGSGGEGPFTRRRGIDT